MRRELPQYRALDAISCEPERQCPGSMISVSLVVPEGPAATPTADDDEPVAEVRGINVHAKRRVDGARPSADRAALPLHHPSASFPRAPDAPSRRSARAR